MHQLDKIKDLIEIIPLCFYAIIETTIKQNYIDQTIVRLYIIKKVKILISYPVLPLESHLHVIYNYQLYLNSFLVAFKELLIPTN